MMKSWFVLVIAVLGVVAAQHAGEAHSGKPYQADPSHPEEVKPTVADQHDYKESFVHGQASASKSRAGEARGNQWERNQREIPEDASASGNDVSQHKVHVQINGIATKKTPECEAPFKLPEHDANSKIEDMQCENPPSEGPDSCPFPTHYVDGYCVPLGPYCPHPLVYSATQKACIPMVPRLGTGSSILDNTYIGAVLRQVGPDYANKPSHRHQPVQNDPDDALMIKDRHSEEQSLWNWEKIRRHTGH